MIWNEPNNKSHWDPELDPEFSAYAAMTRIASQAIAAEAPEMPIVLGGMSPIDPLFAVHGFPLDWNHWQIHDWPAKLDEIRAVTNLPVWVSEVGVSTFGAEEVQEFGLRRTAELLVGQTPRIHWYSLYDLPKTWEATTRVDEIKSFLGI